MANNKKDVRIAFMGTPAFSVDILKALVENGYQIALAFSQDDKVVGRKKLLEKTPVKIFCEEHDIPIFTPKKIDEQAVKILVDFRIDLIILVAYGKILPKTFLETPNLGAINVHPSLLPKFRGPSPVQNTLLAGEKTTGSTIMLMDSGVDTGDILNQKEISVEENETYIELKNRLASFSAALLLETLDQFLSDAIIPVRQDPTRASYCRLIKRKDGQIDWNEPSETIMNKFRAFSGWPGVYTLWESDNQIKRIKLHKISLLEGDFQDKEIGVVFSNNGWPSVRTGSGAIQINSMQLEGKPVVPANNFINGHKNFIGSQLK